jgi:iron-only hydrogenase group A
MHIEVEVNGKKIEARKGDTILAALNRNGIKVPTLCHMKGLSPSGSCRMCVVEVEGLENLVTSCSYPVDEGMKIRTHSTRVLKARKSLVELLLSNHPDDCLYCERNGNCELQDLSIELNIRERRISGRKSKHKLDLSSPSVVRDPAKCILCGRCIRVCDEIQSVATLEFINRGSKTFVGTSMNQNLNISSCIGCGQCIMVCPTAALRERSSLDQVLDAIGNKSIKVVAQIDPAISVSLGEEFGLKPGKDLFGLLVAALRKIGFDFVFDTSFAADIFVMETVAELKSRLESGNNLPLISSNCPAWILYAEQFMPELLPLISTCKSPQQMMGTMVKNHFATSQKIAIGSIYTVSISPCLAAKHEAKRPEMTTKGISEVDAVISTRELVKLIKLYGIDLQQIDANLADSPMGAGSSAGKLFATAGGTTEAVIRTLNQELTGKQMVTPRIIELRSIAGSKSYEIKIGKQKIKGIVCSGLTDIRKVLENISSKKNETHFIEIMACPGGCIQGGGQPHGVSEKSIKLRTKSIYETDEAEPIKFAHKNPMAIELYKNILGNPGSEKAISLLHRKYTKRDVLL